MKKIILFIIIINAVFIELKFEAMTPEAKPEKIIYTVTLYNTTRQPFIVSIKAGTKLKMPKTQLLSSENIDFSNKPEDFPIVITIRSDDNKELAIVDHASKRIAPVLSINNEYSQRNDQTELKLWAGATQAIPIYLVKQEGKDKIEGKERIDAFPYDKYRNFLKKGTRVKRLPRTPINLKETLEIEPGSIQEKVFNYAQTPSSLDSDIVADTTLTDEEKQKKQRYRNINAIIKETNNFEDLKKLVLMQLNMALFIVDHISFAEYESLVEENYPPQERLPSPSDPYKAHWLSVLLDTKQGDFLKFPSHLPTMLKITKLAIVLERIRNLLLDIGFSPSNNPLETLDDIKRAISENFRLLFENLFIVRNVKPSGTLKKLLLPKKVVRISNPFASIEREARVERSPFGPTGLWIRYGFAYSPQAFDYFSRPS